MISTASTSVARLQPRMVVPCARPRLAVLAGSAGSAALCERAPRQQQQPARPWLLRATSGRAAARLLPAAAAASASSAGRGPVELLLDAVPGKSDLLSPKLDPELRQRAEKAITQRGGRVTIGAPLRCALRAAAAELLPLLACPPCLRAPA